MIIRRPTTEQIGGDTVVIKENAGDGYSHGIEVAVNYDLTSTITLFTSAFWLDGKMDTFPDATTTKRREVLDRLQPAQLLFGVRWESEDERYFVEAIARYVFHQRRLSTRDQADTSRIPPNGSHGYALFDLRASAQIIDHIRIFGGVENLTHRSYRVHGSGTNAVGVNAIGGLELTF